MGKSWVTNKIKVQSVQAPKWPGPGYKSFPL